MSVERYTIGEFEQLNHGQVKLPPNLKTVFDAYTMPSCSLINVYGNKHNVRFNKATEATGYQSKMASMTKRMQRSVHDTDDKILLDLRKAFSSVVSGKDGTVNCVNTINQQMIAPKMVDKIATLFYETMIRSAPQIIEQYVDVLFSLKRHDKLETKIQIEFVKQVFKSFKESPTIPESKISSSAELTKNHRIATCNILTQLCNYDYDKNQSLNLSGPKKLFGTWDKIDEKFISRIISLIQDETTSVEICHYNIRCLAEALEILKIRFPELLEKNRESIKEIYKNKKFKLSQKMSLRNFVN